MSSDRLSPSVRGKHNESLPWVQQGLVQRGGLTLLTSIQGLKVKCYTCFAANHPDKPGALGKCLLALAERGVNILAFQSYVEERESLVRFVPDNVATTQAVLSEEGTIFEETDVAMAKVDHVPGALGQAAARLGSAGINIEYSYCGF